MAQSSVFRGTARSVRYREGAVEYCYHSTAVVTISNDGKVTLDSGGHRTNTTKLAMNQASNQNGLGFQVYQKDFGWYVTWRGGKFEFFDGMVLQ